MAMKLEERVEKIRLLIWKAFDKRLQQLGFMANKQFEAEKVLPELRDERKKFDDVLINLIGETGDYIHAREKLVDELSFTLFNRITGMKVMEAHGLIPGVFTRDEAHGGRSFGHKLWLEQNPDHASKKLEGLREYVQYEFGKLADRIQLYSPYYLYNLLPDVFDLNDIIKEFNEISPEDWHSDDIMGWMYEYYNRKKREEFKASGDKIEYQWVSLTSQVYTPRWVVEFILNNSLGKLWMEMYPDSSLKERHDIANIPDESTQEAKPVEEIKILDPAVGSGNFLLYAFNLFYEMYLEEGKTQEAEIPKKIIEKNLYGIDLDDRAVQIAQLGLYIKALKKNKDASIDYTNVVSTDFYLPEYEEIQDFFRELNLHEDSQELLKSIWDDLRIAYKFGSLIRIEERLFSIIERYKQKKQRELFDIGEKDLFDQWEELVIPNIKKAIEKYSTNGNNTGSFFQIKTLESLTFVEILQKKFDVVVTNPPYTDSGNYGSELKAFISANYKKPMTFYPNLFAAFLRRITELIENHGKVGIIHPLTFMYIKSFEDMRKYILNNFHINLFVEYGLSDLFGAIMVDPAIYILEKGDYSGQKSVFVSMNQYTRTPEENFKEQYTKEALHNYINKIPDKNLYTIDQSKLKLIKSWPFIYWISDTFRDKFGGENLSSYHMGEGFKSNNNLKILRFWWEISDKKIGSEYFPYTKGGQYNKWYGNSWLTLKWENNGTELMGIGASLTNYKYYFRDGITFNKSSVKGNSFRLLEKDVIFDSASPSIFSSTKKNYCYYYLLGFLNSQLSQYITKCLNPSVSSQVGDIKRIPFAKPTKELEDKVSMLAEQNVNFKKHFCEFSIIEMNYVHHPLMWAKEKTKASDLRTIIKTYLDYENEQLAQVFLNEAIIDELIFEVYQLSEEDRHMVLDKEGIPIGSLTVIDGFKKLNSELPSFVKDYFDELEVKHINSAKLQSVKKEIEDLYEQNYSIEEISEKVQFHPFSVVKILKESSVMPTKRMNDRAKEFLFDVVREVLQEDDDGIIPLVEYAGEVTVQKRLFDKLVEKGFSPAQIGNYGDILGREINPYLEKNFFADLSDHLNLFMYFPKTPFIWHLSAGEYDSFEAFIIIYKWSRDKMLRLRSIYVEKRESSLKNRLIDLENDFSIQAQSEKELIQNQLEEISKFKKAIDEILQFGYDPTLDDGVGKNIAPLQKKGLLKAYVLTEKELKKYLNTDW